MRMTEQELGDKIIEQCKEIARLEELAVYRASHQRERDEAREGWAYARLTSEQWHQAYNDLLVRSSVRIENATGGNVVFDAAPETLANYVAPRIPVINVNMDELCDHRYPPLPDGLHYSDTCERCGQVLVIDPTPVYCDHSRWREAERALDN